MDEWLPVIPDFELDANRPAVIKSGPVNGVVELQLTWEV
jgi:hypothetical protein